MEEIDNPFKKAGMVLLVIGIIDIAVMAYCISNEISYSSSFNIFAVIAGIFLIKGSVKTARVVRWFSAFFIITFVVMIFLYPVIMPLELLVTRAKLNTASMLGSFSFSIIFMGVLLWLYKELSVPVALAKYESAGYKTGRPKSALFAVLGLIVFGGSLFALIMHGESADKAKTLAKEQLGESYEYHISSIRISGGKGSAVVVAYNSNEIKNINVNW